MSVSYLHRGSFIPPPAYKHPPLETAEGAYRLVDGSGTNMQYSTTPAPAHSTCNSTHRCFIFLYTTFGY